jgi:choline transport protein
MSRIYWSLARDNAVPFSSLFSKVNRKLSCPVPAMLLVDVFCIALGAIGLGSKTAFADLVGSFIILSTTSYALAIAPNLLTGRRYVKPGPFWMGKVGFFINGMAVLLIIFFNIMFCFRKFYQSSSRPVCWSKTDHLQL